MLGLALTPLAAAIQGLFNPGRLFTSGEQGVWYDPSDFSTMFQDSAGTTPVTAVEQPVGLILDKSKGLVLGPELVTNGDFSNGTTGWTLGAGWAIADEKATFSSATTLGNLRQVKTTSGWSKIQFTVSGISSGQGRLIFYTNNAGILIWQNTNLQNGTYSFYTPTPIVSNIDFYAYNADGGSPRVGFSIDNISVKELPGNHATQATSASRPILRQDANGKYYLFFDGVDDSLSTGSIDFTSTDKMTVFAGVRKLGSTGENSVAEHGVPGTHANANTFLCAPGNGGDASAPIASATRPYGGVAVPGAAPLTFVAGVLQDVAVGGSGATNVRIRVNGSLPTQNPYYSTNTTEALGNYPLYIGRRGGTSLPFNGHLYSLIIRGAASSASQIASAESYVNSKTGAY